MSNFPKYTKSAAAAVFGSCLAIGLAEPALAQDIFQTLQQKGSTTFTNVRNVSYILGAFGLISIAVMAFFGRFNFKHLAGLIGGLVIIAAAAAFINYATTGGSGSAISSGPAYQDTMSGTAQGQ